MHDQECVAAQCHTYLHLKNIQKLAMPGALVLTCAGDVMMKQQIPSDLLNSKKLYLDSGDDQARAPAQEGGCLMSHQ